MTTSEIQSRRINRLWSVGLASGVAFAMLFSAWPIVVLMVSGWIIWTETKKQEARLSEADKLRVAGGWFLAVMLCNLLLNWSSVQAGFIAGWQAAS